MSTEVEKEITVVIPSSKVADPEFIQQEVTKAKLRVLIEVHKGSDKTLYGLIKEFLPDVIENKSLLREFNICSESKTEFKLKLSTSEKKTIPEPLDESKKESLSEPVQSVQNSEEKESSKPKISIKPKKLKVKPKVKISKKAVSVPSTSVVKSKEQETIDTVPVETKSELPKDVPITTDKVESPKDVLVTTDKVESPKETPVSNAVNNNLTATVVATNDSEKAKSKPKKKKILKLSKKKTNTA